MRTDVILPYCRGSSAKGSNSTERVEDSCTNGIAVPDPENNPGLVKDCITLLAVKDVLAGDARLDWSTGIPIWPWEGVSVDGTPPRVSGLSLSSKGLTGEIPPEMGLLEYLSGLNLQGNQLTGEIPREIGDLSKLGILRTSQRRCGIIRVSQPMPVGGG